MLDTLNDGTLLTSRVTSSVVVAQIDCYDYERLRFVLDTLNDVTSSKTLNLQLQLLKCIQSYKRVQPPGQYESNYRMVSEDEQVSTSA